MSSLYIKCWECSWKMSYCTSGDRLTLLLSTEFGEMLGLCSPVVPVELGVSGSCPSEFSNISWIRGGIDPGISIFSVITRSAPVKRSTAMKEEIKYILNISSQSAFENTGNSQRTDQHIKNISVSLAEWRWKQAVPRPVLCLYQGNTIAQQHQCFT